MKTRVFIIAALLTLALFGACNKEPSHTSNLPVVLTKEVAEVGTHSAMCSATVTELGDKPINVRGVCWSVNHNPTTRDSFVNSDVYIKNDSTGLGDFKVRLTGLAANETYYVRAYTSSSNGLSYGEELSFTTQSYGSNVPEGGINALFTINENGGKVWFSKGNLQYQASSDTWRFAENQWNVCDSITSDHTTADYVAGKSAWIDLFGWGTSGYEHGAICYQPWSNSAVSSDYNAYGQNVCNLCDQTGMADWGYNAISNGGNSENSGWRTLTKDEWSYLLLERSNSNKLYGHGQVNGKNGLIILPDDWSLPPALLFSPGVSSWQNIYDEKQWAKMETAGAVFLPAAGMRNGSSVYHVLGSGVYWTSTSMGYSNVQFGSYAFYFGYNMINLENMVDRHLGQSVRLVRSAE